MSSPGAPFDPFRDNPGGCYTCRYFLGRYNGQALLCEMPPSRHCPSLPASGCAFWEREPGADDEINSERAR